MVLCCSALAACGSFAKRLVRGSALLCYRSSLALPGPRLRAWGASMLERTCNFAVQVCPKSCWLLQSTFGFGGAIWDIGRTLCLLVLAACLCLATRLARADGGLKIHTRCASWAPKLHKAVCAMQATCQLTLGIWGVRATAGALGACNILQFLCGIIGNT